ncbi:hypothetical protein Dda_4534 [Drechslerella dactyloides]|uniref:Uncharacterized protein n=1 Tax=Drechslerella dactyloides TaxID=74499 RepID=A0AAD6IX37_DREDA|nr:hypothetical protein Dda_4534 [Drechslerella dactyloides]
MYGARGVDREDNPMQVPERRKSWAETFESFKETIGLSKPTRTGFASKPIGFPSKEHHTPSQRPTLSEQAHEKLDNALDDAKRSVETTQTKAQRRGSDILDEVAKEAARRDIGGPQLFGSPKGTNREGTAGNGFLTKYANESAPGENTS